MIYPNTLITCHFEPKRKERATLLYFQALSTEHHIKPPSFPIPSPPITKPSRSHKLPTFLFLNLHPPLNQLNLPHHTKSTLSSILHPPSSSLPISSLPNITYKT